ncbi:GerAB/ArcD/ProY family transporter [Paenibacillus hamazuiensis]|uniref:GerAB/ArcD/ProY family transporter n=1 Tax=Paenibacillus hamazuiensis TaxID=2936508 RepID=UPI00200E2BAC|nr:GerAB/ArcD/ProY family transporter [Paenibacillus hamazuiensis]
MNGSVQNTITSVQAMMIVINTIIGAGVTTLPRDAGKASGTPDAWISVILGGLITLLACYVVGRLSQRFPGQTFFQYSLQIWGKPIGKILGFLLILYFFLIAAWQIRAMGELIRFYLLDNTPIEVIMLVFLWIGVYLADGGIRPIARLCELFFPVLVISLLLTLFLALNDFRLDNIRPILGDGILPVIKGLKSTCLSFTGFEVMLVIAAFMKDPKQAMKAVTIGVLAVIPLYALVVFVTYGAMTFEESKSITWPLMSLAKTIDIPGGFFDRFEALISVMWVIANYTSFVPNYYLACQGMSSLFKKDYRVFLLGLLPLVYMVSIFPENLNVVMKLGASIGYFDILPGGLVPLVCLIMAKIRRIGIAKG